MNTFITYRKALRIFARIFFISLLSIRSFAQDSVVQRIILIGDAGEIGPQQKQVIGSAAGRIIPSRTTVVFLGDNIYPTGMALPGSKKEKETQQIIRSQYEPMRSKGAPVYFIPGNHDWDRMGPDGLKKIKRQWEFLQEQQDSLLQLLPPNGCPGPVEINISDNLVIIAFDSEWWLFVHDKKNPDADCDCNTKEEAIARFEELLFKNRYKTILLASHHPFQSYGHHGGYYSWKDHLFPFTAINKNLYIPLPIIGSLYPLLRKAFTNPEDLAHPLYKDMTKQVDHVFNGFPNVVHVAGHEHGLQFIKDQQTQVVSGSGAKNAYVRQGKNALYTNKTGGFVTADLLTNRNILFTYYINTDSVSEPVFTYIQHNEDVKLKEDTVFNQSMGDSATVKVHPAYDDVSKFHRYLFGENYRKEWAASTTLPVIKISTIKGGLTPVKRGGGHQSKSLRLKDKNGNEWALRSVEKYPDVLLPEQLRQTFAKDVVYDAMSAQHPFSALAVPVIANAVNVPHSNPIIGIVAPDSALGIYAKTFVNTVCLLEEREPLGKSDNTFKMAAELDKDNDNNVDSVLYLRAKLLDLYIGDWDRHEDQWRWVDTKKGKGKTYTAVPRDRDQVFHVEEGVFPTMAAREWIAPFLHNFDGSIKKTNFFFWSARYMNARLLNQFNYQQWMAITNDFVAKLTDSVLEAALQKLPGASYQIRHDELLRKLKERRANLPKAMEAYYRFYSKTIDIQTTTKSEFVKISSNNDSSVNVSIKKIAKDGDIKQSLYDRTFLKDETNEIRIFTSKGDDSVAINNQLNSIKFRIVGGDGKKAYNIENNNAITHIYENKDNATFTGSTRKIRKHLSNDSSNTAIVPSNIYNIAAPLITAGYNIDDGLILGLGVKYTQQGFRKRPYGSVQQITAAHSFSTKAYRIRYRGEWIKAIGNADIVAYGNIYAPDNTINFFGSGNETEFNKTGDYKRYYRTRFALYEAMPSLRWRTDENTSITVGPAVQFYHYDSTDNVGRVINNNALILSYDSATIAYDKSHIGFVANFVKDSRNNKLLPTWGSYISVRVQGFKGLNKYSKSFGQIIPEIALYKSVNARSSIVIADRLGGGFTIGNAAFYQSMFLDGRENLSGYRRYRFAGTHMVYNNFEARIKLADFANYILPGQFGMIAFYDIGRVWQKDEDSHQWHNAVGAGIYFAPAQLALFQFLLGYSKEGLYPYLTMGFRF